MISRIKRFVNGQYLALLLIVLIWIPFSSIWHSVWKFSGVYCSLILLTWLLIQAYRPESDKRAQQTSRFEGWSRILACVIVIVITVDLFHLSLPGIKIDSPSARILAIVVSAVLIGEHLMSRLPYGRLGLLALCAVLLTYLLIWCNLEAKFFLTDDHSIVHFMSLGSGGLVTLSDIPQLLYHHTEIGQILPRFRPMYWTLLLTEVFLWGKNPTFWYVSRMVMFATSMILFWRPLAAWIGNLPAALVVLYCLTPGFWAEIWCRLGTNEAYAAFGTALFAYSSHRLLSSETQIAGVRTWIFLILGAVIAVGSKENFAIVVPAAWVIVLIVWARGKMTGIGICSIAAITSFGAWVSWRLAAGLSAAGADEYGRSVLPLQRIALASDSIANILNAIGLWNLVGIIIFIIGLCFLVLSNDRIKPAIKVLGQFFIFCAALVLFYVSQYVFYNGEWPCGSRYDFPGFLAMPLFWVGFAFFSLKFLQAMGMQIEFLRMIRAGLIVGLIGLILSIGFDAFSVRCCHTAYQGARSREKLDEIAHRVREQPNKPIILTALGTPLVFEPVFSIRRFLTSRDVQNPFFLRPADIQAKPGFEQGLVERLQLVSEAGFAKEKILPLSSLPTNVDAFVVNVWSPPDAPSLPEFWLE